MAEKFETEEQDADAMTALDIALREVAGLRRALETRTTIGQAVGILMAHRSLTVDGAFAHLVELSSHSNTKLRDVAAAVVAHTEQAGTPRRDAHPSQRSHEQPADKTGC